MKNILFSGVAYYPNVGYGGPVRVMRSYGLGLTSLGHKVTIYCSNLIDRQHTRMAAHTVETQKDNMRVVYMNTDLRMSDGLTISLDLWRYLRREINNYDVVHLYGCRSFFVSLAGGYARRFNIPYIIHPMASTGYVNSKVTLKSIWDALYWKKLMLGAKYVVEATQEQLKDLFDFGIPKSRTAVVPWSPDPDLANFPVERGGFRAKLGISSNEKVILFLGRIHRKKNIDLIIQALALLKDPTARLVVVGHDDDGSLGQLKKLTIDLGLEEKVIWAGAIHAPESAIAYQEADIFVLVSQFESAPMAVLEAGSMGVPLLISDNLGISEMVDKQAGLVVDTTPEAVATGFRTLLRDEQLRKRYAIGARAMIEKNFSTEAVGSQLVSLYD
jgi:glycosyltransferase involved in cell wall biosynthesis